MATAAALEAEAAAVEARAAADRERGLRLEREAELQRARDRLDEQAAAIERLTRQIARSRATSPLTSSPLGGAASPEHGHPAAAAADSFDSDSDADSAADDDFASGGSTPVSESLGVLQSCPACAALFAQGEAPPCACSAAPALPRTAAAPPRSPARTAAAASFPRSRQQANAAGQTETHADIDDDDDDDDDVFYDCPSAPLVGAADVLAALWAAGRPLSAPELLRVFGARGDARSVALALRQSLADLDSRGAVLVQLCDNSTETDVAVPAPPVLRYWPAVPH
jgi:hypothetical protein